MRGEVTIELNDDFGDAFMANLNHLLDMAEDCGIVITPDGIHEPVGAFIHNVAAWMAKNGVGATDGEE